MTNRRQRCPIGRIPDYTHGYPVLTRQAGRGVDDVSLVKPLTCTEQFGKRDHVPPLAKRCSTFAFGSYPWPLA